MEREAQTGVLKAGRGRSEWGRLAVPRGDLVGTWPPRGSRVLARSERERVMRAGAARRGPRPAKRLLGQGEARGAGAGRERERAGAAGRICERARREAAAC